MSPASDWMLAARCRGVDPDVFHPVEHSTERLEDAEADAKTYCRACDVVADCLDFALANHLDRYGIYGGLNPKERRRVVRKRREIA